MSLEELNSLVTNLLVVIIDPAESPQDHLKRRDGIENSVLS